jgi:GNAT superfamily N-acetyltransferase
VYGGIRAYLPVFKAKQRQDQMSLHPEIQIREAGEKDLGLLNALADAHGYKEKNYFIRCFEEKRVGRRVILAALDAAGQGIGYVMLNRQPLYQPFRSTGTFEIQDLFVLPEWRRQGLGEALVAKCEEMAKAAGSDMVGLAVGLHSGFGAAQRLYVRMGYMPDGFGVVYNSESVKPGVTISLNDDLCLMMVKGLTASL